MPNLPEPIDLSPAQWIWFPSQRTLANSMVLFRRELNVASPIKRATGYVTADSRYRLTLNGQRVQWGPPPCDPRWMDADPVDLTSLLKPGPNVIGAQVLYYGSGDGTWATGKPGFLFRLDIEYADGRTERIISDPSWLCCLDRAYRPGQYRRWYLRAFQEEFDARQHPHGWDTTAFAVGNEWLPAMAIPGPANKPTLCLGYSEYSSDSHISNAAETMLLKRQIPLLRETLVPAKQLQESGRIEWLRDPLDWFEFRTPNAFRILREPVADPGPGPRWPIRVEPQPAQGVYLTFEFSEQIVGWPYFTIDAPEGTIIEVMTQEGHDPAQTAWLDSHHYSWARFICRKRLNRFEHFDFESLRWLQLHIRNANGPVVVSEVGVRRRIYDWPHPAAIKVSEPKLQRLFDASVNTLHNCAQETCVDGMGRERQQYSGDGSHQLHAIWRTFGETRLPARFLRTFSQGSTLDGYFLDCWPAYDRLARLMQRQVGATGWGPLLDHGVGFNFDCWNYYWETADPDPLREPFPRLLRFAEYLEKLRRADGLLPVENIGVPAVWIDHEAYQQQKHKQCAFNLYAAAMFQHALAPICQALGRNDLSAQWQDLGKQVQATTIHTFWDPQRRVFVVNRPWLASEPGPRMCDRSLATAILFDQCPNGDTDAALKALAESPKEMGLSYPANAGWRFWALAKLGRIDVVLADLRQRWTPLRSVIDNNTLQEGWNARPDSGDQFSHCPVVPLYILFMDIAGIRALAPGFAKLAIRPQLGDLKDLDLTAHTVRGPIHFTATASGAGHRITLDLPPNCEPELHLPPETTCNLPKLGPDAPGKLTRFKLRAGDKNVFTTSRR